MSITYRASAGAQRAPVGLPAGGGRTLLGSAMCGAEVLDSLCEPRRLIQRNERVAVSDFGQAALGEDFGEAPAMFWWHDTVSGRPDHER